MSLINTAPLLDRTSFREGVFNRDGYKCVICGTRGYNHPDVRHFSTLQKSSMELTTLDAHHIIERRLWDDGGYYLENGATLCDEYSGYVESGIGCHMKAEMTVLSCDEIRRSAGITKTILPDHMYRDNVYDKWGNIINPDGTRTKGELFNDESVQKVLKAGGVLDLFRDRVKYPRTYHLPWSPGLIDDDRQLDSTSIFEGREVVMSEKMDGENTSLYSDYIHARSLDSGSHPSRGWVKNLHGTIQGHIPPGWRICGENLFAKHSVAYDALPSYFMVFSIWDDRNVCLSWDETVEWCALLELEMVPVLYRGPWNEAKIREIEKSMDLTTREGYTVRVADEFTYGSFRKSIAKFVRKNHVQSTHNWMMQAVVKNGLR